MPRSLRCARLGPFTMALVSIAAWVAVPGGGMAAAASSGSGNGAPGVTSTSITTGAIGTLSGSIAADFDKLVPGVRAYFDMVNAQGGINGRKLLLSYNLDDGGSPSEFTSEAHALVNQDHVFAAVGISSYWFSPGFFAQSGLPTYGYNVSDNWAGPPNLFAANGSVICNVCGAPGDAYLAKRTGSKSVAFLAYNVSSSRAACAAEASALKNAGVNVSYTDYNVPIDGNITPDIQRMQQAKSDLVISCMDVNENITMARAIKQYGLNIKQLWFNGADQAVVDSNKNLMQNVYLLLQSVPLTAPTKYYPGLKAYLAAMNKYEPQYAGDSLAVQGWGSAALFAAGVRAAGNNLTQQRVIQLTNKMTAANGDGMTLAVDWTKSHTQTTYPSCQAYVKVQGSRMVSTFGQGHQVFVCFAKGAVKNPTPVKAPPGTPGT